MSGITWVCSEANRHSLMNVFQIQYKRKQNTTSLKLNDENNF